MRLGKNTATPGFPPGKTFPSTFMRLYPLLTSQNLRSVNKSRDDGQSSNVLSKSVGSGACKCPYGDGQRIVYQCSFSEVEARGRRGATP